MSVQFIVRRVLVSLVIGLVIGLAISEIAFYFVRETARPPGRIELVIPAGTAEQVARGESNPELPEEMIFVVGDTLVVRNEDQADHKLGPLWVPAGASASLTLDSQANYAFECSFQPQKYLGLDVREPLTMGTRLIGILSAGLPLGVLIALYSLIAVPEKRKPAG